MGFTQVILIGVDHSFASKGEANKTVVSDGDDPNHFLPIILARASAGSCRPGNIRNRLCLARKAYERTGRQVLDATVGGKLTPSLK